MKKPLSLAQRGRRTQRLIDIWRERPLDWRARHHCIALAHAQARAMGVKVPALPSIRSPRAARRALTERGCETVEQLLDTLFVRIPPAMMRVGDLCTVPGGHDPDGPRGLAAVMIADGQGNVFGWHAATGFRRIESVLAVNADCTGAWRIGW